MSPEDQKTDEENEESFKKAADEEVPNTQHKTLPVTEHTVYLLLCDIISVLLRRVTYFFPKYRRLARTVGLNLRCEEVKRLCCLLSWKPVKLQEAVIPKKPLTHVYNEFTPVFVFFFNLKQHSYRGKSLEHRINIYLSFVYTTAGASEAKDEAEKPAMVSFCHPCAVTRSLFLYCPSSIAQEPQTQEEEVEKNSRPEERSEQQAEDKGEETDTFTLHYCSSLSFLSFFS